MTKTRALFAACTLVAWSAMVFGQSMNTLTAQEKTQGWQLLFDGKTLNGWHSAAPPPARGRAAGAPSPTPGRAGAPQGPTPGQVGTSKPCVGARGAATAAVPAGGSHWEVVNGTIMPCGDP